MIGCKNTLSLCQNILLDVEDAIPIGGAEYSIRVLIWISRVSTVGIPFANEAFRVPIAVVPSVVGSWSPHSSLPKMIIAFSFRFW